MLLRVTVMTRYTVLVARKIGINLAMLFEPLLASPQSQFLDLVELLLAISFK